MIRLDEQLADVFRQHLKKNKKNSNQIDEAEKFRLRCFDLIVVAVRGSKNAEVFIVSVSKFTKNLQLNKVFGSF